MNAQSTKKRDPAAENSAKKQETDYRRLNLPRLNLRKSAPGQSITDKNGQKVEVFPGYALQPGIMLRTDLGDVHWDDLDHSQMIWLMANKPGYFRQYASRAYYPANDPYWRNTHFM